MNSSTGITGANHDKGFFFSPFFASFFYVFLLTHLPSLYSLLLLGLFTPFLFTSVSFKATSLFRGDYHCSAGLTGISMLHLAAALTVLPMLRVPPALMRSQVHVIIFGRILPFLGFTVPSLLLPKLGMENASGGKVRSGKRLQGPPFPTSHLQ